MAAKNKLNITSDIVAEIRSGNSDTTALGLRTILYEILDSYANVKDGGLLYETAVGYNGLLTLTDPKSFVYKQWVEDYVSSNATSALTLAEVVANGNTVNGIVAQSLSSYNYLEIEDNYMTLVTYAGGNANQITLDNYNGNRFYSDIKNRFDSPVNEFTNGGIYFVSGIGIDTTSTAGTDVLNIGATNANVINYGNASTIHNFLGTAIYELQVNSYVTDKLITLNAGGSIASGIGVGFEVEENSVITSYFKTNSSRDGFSFLTPAISYKADLLLSALTDNRSYTLQDKTGVIAHLDDITGYGTTSLEPVISKINTPVGSPATGDRYLVGTTPTGAFVGNANSIAVWGGVSYTYTIPSTNNIVYVTNTLTTLRYNGTSWVAYNGTAVLNYGNTVGSSLNIGTNDNFDVNFKRNNITQWSINSSGWLVRATGTKIVSLNDGFITITDSASNATPGFQITQTMTLNRFSKFIRFGSTGGVNFVGTGVSSDDVLLISNGGNSSNPYPVFTRGSILYNISGHTATNIGTRLDTVGLRVGTLNTLHTSNTNVFDVRGKFHHDKNDNVVVGSAALATTATDGFFYIPSCAGIPTGVPTAKTGRVPMMYDSTNNKFYIYNGAWKSVALI